MNLIDAVVLWCPASGPSRFAGRALVTTLPTPEWTFDYSHSVGACNLGWGSVSDDERKRWLRRIFNQMVTSDGVPEEVARGALAAIDDVEEADLFLETERARE